jgi:hypothetical protein
MVRVVRRREVLEGERAGGEREDLGKEGMLREGKEGVLREGGRECCVNEFGSLIPGRGPR